MKHHRFAVIGAPGCGKTTMAKHMNVTHRIVDVFTLDTGETTYTDK